MSSPIDGWFVPDEAEPPGIITHCKVMRNNGIASVSLPSGDIDAFREPATGIYFQDTRYIAELSVTLAGALPRLLDAKLLPHALTAVYTNPPLLLLDGTTLAGQQLVLRRRRVIDETVVESFAVSNYCPHEVVVPLVIHVGADFRDIFEVRGFSRRSPDPVVRTDERADAVEYSALGADGIERTVVVQFSRPADRVGGGQAQFLLTVPAQATEQVELEIAVATSPRNLGFTVSSRHVREAQHAWLDAAVAIETDNERVNDAVRQALLDVHALQSTASGHRYLAAGVPWFDALFGRDSLIAGIELAGVVPGVLRDALESLAAYQATSINVERDAEPGKIPHELRWGELAGSGEVPFGAYYGSVDATPLFIMGAAEYLRWTGDLAFVESIWPALQRAMEWCRQAEVAGAGAISYRRMSRAGLDHQGWKDSHDGIAWPDGSPVAPAVALVEVQAYLAAAYAAYAYAGERLDKPAELVRLARQRSVATVEDLRRFEHETLGYVLCLDGDGRPVPTPASNGGHVLWAGAAARASAARVARLLLSPEMFSGWGVRTLSSAVPQYNPLGYHTGSVWPHDSALALAGLRRYGFDDEASQLGSALVDLFVELEDHRVPELLSGEARALRLVPTPFPVSSRPQAWSAAAVPYVLLSMLGIRPRADGAISVTRPLLPSGIQWVRLCGLKRGTGSCDLLFTRHEGHVAVQVDRLDGQVEVVLSRSLPDPLLGAET